ncbi:hypothetical protein [Domibacillus indicus]|uniref:hypothetical protein n=1 Tax=Domibacillus indicus TaxID=1437523 RepID=UPI000617E3AA|nr:hypothetical protein [Domibacillus indicus]
MDFLLVGLLLWGLLAVAVILLAAGLWKKSWKAMLGSGLAFVPPTLLIALGDSGPLFKLTLLVPVAVLAAAFYMKKRSMYFI